MPKLLSTTNHWLAICLIAASSVFAQDPKCRQQKLEQGHEASKNQLANGYSAPARIEVRGSWDVYATGSFIYWQARQENIEIGVISRNNPANLVDTPFNTSYVNNMKVTQPNFVYRPGFKFGLGLNLDWDNWDAYTEYTWFHGTAATGLKPLAAATTGTEVPPNGEFLYPIQGAPQAMMNFYFQDANQSWNLKMDFADLSLARSYYSGTRLTIRPFFGARGAWIRQHLDTLYVGSTNYSGMGESSGFYTAQIYDESVSWGIGPRTGFQSNWLLGYGTRLIGNGSGDILYTRYSLRQNQQITSMNPSATPIVTNASLSQEIDYLRAHADFEMGFGWGTYFDNNNWHVDLSATYGFQVFWDQNMFRNFEESTNSFAPNGNLFVHGLNLNATLDF